MLDPKTDVAIQMKKLLLEQFQPRFECIEQVTILTIATILDPRFKQIHFCKEVAYSHAVNIITRAVNNSVATNITDEAQDRTQIKITHKIMTFGRIMKI